MNPHLPPLALLGLVAAACRGPLPITFLEESPAGSGTWTTVAAEPAWVTSPPPRADHARVVVVSRSNLREIAIGNLAAAAARDVADRVRAALRPVVTTPEADAAADAAIAAMRLVGRACRDEVLTRDVVVGNTMATVWGLYEFPLTDVLAVVHDPHRAIARAALAKH